MNNRLMMLMTVLVVLLAGQVVGLGITPGRTNIGYAPGTEKTVEFSIINSDKQDIDLVVLVRGDLNKSISISEASFSMAANEESKTLTYTMSVPSGLSPGQHRAEITVVQLPSKSNVGEAYVGAAVGVITQADVFVPYPDKYAEASLSIIGGGADEVTFVIPVLNKGSIDIVRARATIDIYSSLNAEIASVSTPELSVGVQSREDLVAKWGKDVPPGPYRAVATVIYDEEIITLEQEFNIGVKELFVDYIEVPNFQLGEIAKFETMVENKWSELISNAYVQMKVFDDNNDVMADYKSATYEVPSLSKALLVSYWDTAGIGAGTYDADVILHYGQKSSTNKVQFDIADDELRVIGVGYVISSAGKKGDGMSGMTITLIIVIAVLVIINLLWFLALRKRMNSK